MLIGVLRDRFGLVMDVVHAQLRHIVAAQCMLILEPFECVWRSRSQFSRSGEIVVAADMEQFGQHDCLEVALTIVEHILRCFLQQYLIEL